MPDCEQDMRILPSLKTNRKSVLRNQRYRGEIKVTEQDRRDHAQINWDPQQVPAKMLAKDGDKFTLENFRWGFEETEKAGKTWKPQFSDTEIDTSKVKDVYLTLQPFNPEIVAAHGLIMFEMQDGESVRGASGQKDVGLALSVEARSPEGEGYNLMKGLKKTFGQVYQLGSLSDQMQKVGRQRGHKLILHKLKLSAEQKKALLQDSLEAAAEDRFGEWYHLLTNSCITADIDLINGVLPVSKQMARWSRVFKFARPATMLPVVAGATLKGKGILAEGPVKVINPDPEIFPDIQQKKTARHKAIGKASRSIFWKPSFRVGGATLGGVLGHALGSTFGAIGAAIGASAGFLSGLYVGDRTADLLAVKNDISVLSQTQWYANTAGITVDEATNRIKNPSGVSRSCSALALCNRQ